MSTILHMSMWQFDHISVVHDCVIIKENYLLKKRLDWFYDHPTGDVQVPKMSLVKLEITVQA